MTRGPRSQPVPRSPVDNQPVASTGPYPHPMVTHWPGHQIPSSPTPHKAVQDDSASALVLGLSPGRLLPGVCVQGSGMLGGQLGLCLLTPLSPTTHRLGEEEGQKGLVFRAF